ncbi:hypothetical protein R1sor_011629 [Riccia sorocarpa]|uniref:Transposase n=1 Tax=Riccia sorocarpa TaxID=122646 RepID=A0ABD3I1U0_9MARC
MEAEIEEREEIFVGKAAARKVANFVPLIDVAAGLMNINKIPIQWWRPKHASSKASDEDRYAQCIQRDVVWEIDPGYTGRHWVDADSCVYAWKSRAKKDKVHLPKKQDIALFVLKSIHAEASRTLATTSHEESNVN